MGVLPAEAVVPVVALNAIVAWNCWPGNNELQRRIPKVNLF
jgi:hypothetical protein